MRILLVEDQVVAGEGLRALLEEDGHQVRLVPSFRAASEYISPGCCEVALLDLKLPDGNGRDLIPILREHCPGARIYLASGSSVLQDDNEGLRFEDIVEVAKAVGADGCLDKPIAYDKLLALLECD